MNNAVRTVVCSDSREVEIGRDLPTVVIGERINPTGRKKVLAALKEGNFDIVRQDAIDSVQTPSLIVLGYGLCGNGLNGIKAGPHTLLIPRADDCIAMLLGSRHAYMQQFEATPGTYYLSKGWLESGSHPLKEYLEYRETYGEEDAAWIMDQQYQNYERLVFVAHSQEDLEAYRQQALEVARYCERWGMRYEEILGSDAFVRRLLEVAANLDRASADFVIVPPDDLRRQIWRQISDTIVEAIVTFLSRKSFSAPGLPEHEDLGHWFFRNSVRPFHPHLETRFRLRQPIIGIGAPAQIFLREAAEILHTDLVLPPHHQVANAVGAIAGSVVIAEEILVYPRLSGEGLDVVGYYVQASDNRLQFESAAALTCARRLCKERALQNALRSGADNPQVILEESPDGLDTYRVRARAVGSPRLQRDKA